MRVIKKINNNVALCIDENGNQLIAFGKGIGFNTIPYDLDDLSLVSKTFYQVKPEYLNLLDEIPSDVIALTMECIDYARKELNGNLNKSLFFTLVDHINYTINRAKQGIYIQNGMASITQIDYPIEMAIAKKIVKQINNIYKISLNNDEACFIAIHIIDAENDSEHSEKTANDSIIQQCKEIIEQQCNISIDQNSFYYTRFVMHIKNLIFRKNENSIKITENGKLFETIKKTYPKSYKCSLVIKRLFKEQMNFELSDEELVYLILHINQLYTREN